MTKCKKTFTLVEVLAVIAIIGILAGLIFPMVGRSREKARETQAAAGANSIAIALRSFKTSYQKFPIPLTDPVGGNDGAGATTFANLNDYDKIIFTLSGTLPGGGKDDTNFPKVNTKKTAFLDLPADYMKEGGFYANPWGRRYWIVYAKAGENTIEFKQPVNGSLSSKTIKVGSEVAVFSELNPKGSDFKEGTKLATSWGGVIDVK